ncbi:MAG: hypothetical protein IT581_22350 [Verrucomicrobiales bacterium]|nr:hypothetical protein [Verrucomicrobiales bacterium]
MPWQLIYTSAPQGLAAGHSGFCTVARSAELREALVRPLEQLSYYSHSRTDAPGNLVVSAFRSITLRGSRYYLLSRIQDAGLDFTNRTNFIAHHLIFEESEARTLPPPAVILRDWPGWRSTWSGAPRFLGPVSIGELAPLGGKGTSRATAWEQATGDATAVSSLLHGPCLHGSYLLADSAPLLLELFCETSLLSGQGGGANPDIWKFSFTTCLQPEDDPRDFAWRGCPRDSAIHGASVRQGLPLLDVRTLRPPANPSASSAVRMAPRLAPKVRTASRRVQGAEVGGPPDPAVPAGGPALADEEDDGERLPRRPGLRPGKAGKRSQRWLWLSMGGLAAVLLGFLWLSLQRSGLGPRVSVPPTNPPVLLPDHGVAGGGVVTNRDPWVPLSEMPVEEALPDYLTYIVASTNGQTTVDVQASKIPELGQLCTVLAPILDKEKQQALVSAELFHPLPTRVLLPEQGVPGDPYLNEDKTLEFHEGLLHIIFKDWFFADKRNPLSIKFAPGNFGADLQFTAPGSSNRVRFRLLLLDSTPSSSNYLRCSLKLLSVDIDGRPRHREAALMASKVKHLTPVHGELRYRPVVSIHGSDQDWFDYVEKQGRVKSPPAGKELDFEDFRARIREDRERVGLRSKDNTMRIEDLKHRIADLDAQINRTEKPLGAGEKAKLEGLRRPLNKDLKELEKESQGIREELSRYDDLILTCPLGLNDSRLVRVGLFLQFDETAPGRTGLRWELIRYRRDRARDVPR